MSTSEPRSWPLRRDVLTLVACCWVALLAYLRLECVRLGPDPDTDAYGHYGIARQLLETPGNLRIHWVWLPGYHALLAPLVAAGLSLDGVRVLNALLAAVPPLLLLGYLRGSEDAHGARSVSALAAILAAAAPIAMRMGTTGQMEVCFSVLVLGAALLLARERSALAALVLSVAALIRYEAWAAVAAIGLAMAIRALRARALPRASDLACVLGPLLAVLGWAGARWAQGEAWFGFLFENQAFAERALGHAVPDARWFASALARYPLTLPALSFGLPAVFALIGIARTARREGVWLVLIPLSMLVFLVSGTLSRSHLGLERHFLALVPFFAIWIAHGVARFSEWSSETYRRHRTLRGAADRSVDTRFSARFAASTRGVSFGLLALGAFCAQQMLLAGSWGAWRETTRAALSSERAAARFVASLPPASLVVCDEASVELLSGVAPERFWRARVQPDLVPELLRRAETRDVFVVSRSERTRSLPALGASVYRSENGGAFEALHVDARRAPRSAPAPSGAMHGSIATAPDSRAR